jgi:hypothetical protein
MEQARSMAESVVYTSLFGAVLVDMNRRFDELRAMIHKESADREQQFAEVLDQLRTLTVQMDEFTKDASKQSVPIQQSATTSGGITPPQPPQNSFTPGGTVAPNPGPSEPPSWPDGDCALKAIKAAEATNVSDRVSLIVDAIDAVTALRPSSENLLRSREIAAELQRRLYQKFPTDAALAVRRLKKAKG